MKTSRGTAPGKIILFGEHAVVYGRPALAVPVHDVQATAVVEPAPPGSGLTIEASDLGLTVSLADAGGDPLALAARLVLDHLNARPPDARIVIRSTIPIASGLGSGAAVSAALARALAAHLDAEIPTPDLSALVYEVEKVHHGTPSGIDNTVVCYGLPVHFVRDKTIETLHVGAPFDLLIGDTGIASPTRVAVGDVRAAWQANRAAYELIFDQIGAIAQEARRAIESGQPDDLGPLMKRNHDLLRQINVSSPELDMLVAAALDAGALGAKLSGGGRGGNMIALVQPGDAPHVRAALKTAGAVNVISTTVRASGEGG
jgi:mevalonate kinase